jgi:hypothetical protein
VAPGLTQVQTAKDDIFALDIGVHKQVTAVVLKELVKAQG